MQAKREVEALKEEAGVQRSEVAAATERRVELQRLLVGLQQHTVQQEIPRLKVRGGRGGGGGAARGDPRLEGAGREGGGEGALQEKVLA